LYGSGTLLHGLQTVQQHTSEVSLCAAGVAPSELPDPFELALSWRFLGEKTSTSLGLI
jgi:hypothetical protein